MKRQVPWSVFAPVAVLLVAGLTAQAAAPTQTRITVDKMHCKGCAQHLANQLYKVPGVAKVETNIEAKMMFVTARPESVLSPRVLWEAVEKAKRTPVKLEGPSGTFTAKPQV